MAEQIPSAVESSKTPMGPPPDLESLHREIDLKRQRVAGVYEVYMAACIIWNREKAILDEMEDKLELLKQGQLCL